MIETFSFPRKKHSHRCALCRQAVYCYKSHCTKPAKIEACPNCAFNLSRGRGETLPGARDYAKHFAACQAGGMSSGESHEYATELSNRSAQ